MQKTEVYNFTKYDIISNQTITSKKMATLDTIKRAEGEPLVDTEKEIDTSRLDLDGRYREPKE